MGLLFGGKHGYKYAVIEVRQRCVSVFSIVGMVWNFPLEGSDVGFPLIQSKHTKYIINEVYEDIYLVPLPHKKKHNKNTTRNTPNDGKTLLTTK